MSHADSVLTEKERLLPMAFWSKSLYSVAILVKSLDMGF